MRFNSDKVELAMNSAGINTYGEFAKRMGCSRQNLSVILTRGSCSFSNVCKMAEILNVGPEEIAVIKED